MCCQRQCVHAICITLMTISLFLVPNVTIHVHAAPVLFIANLDDIDDVPGIVGNESVIDRLMFLGHDVETVDHLDAMSVDPTGKELIVISSSSASSSVGFHFTDEPIPIVQWESALWDEMLVSAAGPNLAGETEIDVVDIDHPLAQLMGLTELGEVVVRDVDTTFHGGSQNNLAPDAIVIAQQAFGDAPLIAVVDEGGELNNGDLAPATRIMLFHGDEALDGVNEIGLQIFDGAIQYILGDAGGPPRLLAGDADQDFDFDQVDIVRVQIAAKYLTGQAATWGEGDWDGAPGGQQGSPPPGNGMFDQLDIVAALASGHYLTGPYAAIGSGGTRGDAQTSVVYNAVTGEVEVDAPAGVELTSINIDSAGGIFTGDAAANLGGSFDNDADDNIFKATFGSSFGTLSFGNVAQSGLSEDFVANDLTVIGSLAGGGDLGNVDLIYVPEPASILLAALGLLGLVIANVRRGQGIASRGAGPLVIAAVFVTACGVSARADLIAYWPLDEGAGSSVVDATGNGHDGELFGDTAWTDGNFGGGLEFDGSSDFVEIPDDDAFQFTDADSFTVTAWVYHDVAPGGGWRGIVTKSRDDAPWWGIWTNNTWRFGARPNNNVNGNVAEDGWTHIAIVADVDAGTRHLYENGEETAIVDEITSYDGFGDVWFGGAKSVNEWFEGILDEVRVYDEVLDADAILAVMAGPDVGTRLQAGDADQDFDFDQLDLVQVQIAAKYLTGQPATWGDGDWDGAPGGKPGSPPPGNGLFDQIDVIAALSSGVYLTGPYGAVNIGGVAGDARTSVIYDANTGEVGVDAPAGTELTSINIDSAAGIFTGDPSQNLGGSFDNDADDNIFKATFGGSFGSLSFGDVAQTGLAQDFVLGDLTVIGSLAGGGDLGDVDLIYVPEPAAIMLLVAGIIGWAIQRRVRLARPARC